MRPWVAAIAVLTLAGATSGRSSVFDDTAPGIRDRPAPAPPSAHARLTPAMAWTAVVVGGVLLATVVADTLAPVLRPQGVTLVDGVELRKGNGEGFQKAIEQPLSQGVEFRVIDERPGWLQIVLPDGKGGWIRAVQAGTA